jgi:dolichol-phosphate mannosyltransferase
VDYSIVIPVYFNEGCLHVLFDRLAGEVIQRLPERTAEIVFVDDGSGDRSLEELLALQAAHPDRIRILKFTRNFGQVSAIYAGLEHANGSCAVVMSADGQDPAALVREMLDCYFRGEAQVVVAARSGRDESWFRRMTSRVFYGLMRRLSFPDIPRGGFDFVLMGRPVVDLLLRNREAHPFLQGQILWTGFKPKVIEYFRQRRVAGRSRWSLGRKLTYLLDGVMGYSFTPMRLMSAVGSVVALMGFLYALVVVIVRLFGGIPARGWAPLMIVMLVLGGLQMLMLGIIGEYLWRTLAQARARDPYVIERIYERRPRATAPPA